MNRRHFLVPAVLLLAAIAPACGEDAPAFGPAITVAKSCVAPGEEQSIEVRTAAKAKLAYAIQYPDGSPEMQPPVGDADKDGTYVGRWKMPAKMPNGKVSVTVLVAHKQQTAKEPRSFQLEATCPASG